MENKTKIVSQARRWSVLYRNVSGEIVCWCNPESAAPDIWNFYIFLREDKCVNFHDLWLPDNKYQFSPESPVRYTNDYYGNKRLSSIEFHGGITYYEKAVHTEPRTIKVGCDYNHLYDDETSWSLSLLICDFERAVDSCYELEILKTE